MTNEERDLISQFVARVSGNASAGFTRSVPATTPSLPPIDPEADAFIGQQFQAHPEARYRITQMAVVQEAALAEAANRIQRLQVELQAAQQQAQAQPAPQSRGFLGGLFGGGQPQQAPPVWNQGRQPGAPPPGYGQQGYAQPVPPPQYPPNMQPGMLQSGGSGFLGSALTTAAGVAGGLVAGNALMGLFSGNHGGGMFGGGMGGGMGSGMMPGGETIINNNYGTDPGAIPQDPWGNATQQPDPGISDGGWGDNTQAPDNGGGWDDNSGGGGGGFDDNSSF